jgi:hypothetical protein
MCAPVFFILTLETRRRESLKSEISIYRAQISPFARRAGVADLAACFPSEVAPGISARAFQICGYAIRAIRQAANGDRPAPTPWPVHEETQWRLACQERTFGGRKSSSQPFCRDPHPALQASHLHFEFANWNFAALCSSSREVVSTEQVWKTRNVSGEWSVYAFAACRPTRRATNGGLAISV